MTGKKSKKLEGKFTIKEDNLKPKVTKNLRPYELERASRVVSAAKRFSEADLDPDRGTNSIFRTRDDRCVLLGLRCECQKPCFDCPVGSNARSEIRFMIEVHLGVVQ